MWRERVLDNLPRNIDSLAIKIEHAEIEIFTTDEITTLLGAASERTKLYLLLMMNLGGLQSDLAELLPSEFDVPNKRITRQRTKTRNASPNVPVVSWRLWDETFDLLAKHRTTNPKADCLLVNENGLPIYRRTLRDDGKYSTCDNIKKAYERTCCKLKIKTKPLMLLRKTAASKLEEHETYGRFSQYYLGQAPQSLAERRYAKPSPEQFDKAMIWLGQQFGFKTSK